VLILCTILISLFRPDVLLSILLTFKPIRRGVLVQPLRQSLSARNPPDPSLIPLFFSGEGLLFSSGPFSYIDVRSFFCCLPSFSFSFFLLHFNGPNISDVDVLLKNPVTLKVLVWSRGQLVTLQILTSSSFSW